MRSGARFAVACGGVLFSATATADPIPVLTVSVHDRGPSADQVARVVLALGADARAGDDLRREMLSRFGRYAPQEDVLRPQREAITAGENAYFAQGRAAGRRRIQPALAAMEAAPDALELQENNRAAYLKGLFLLARMAHEERHPDEAETWLRRAFAFDPWWMPSNYDCPERFRPVVARLRPAAATSTPARATGTLSVRAPREGCTLSVDDARSPSTAQTVEQPVTARSHRVSLRCAEASRVRTVTVTAGATTALAIDPRLDSLLRVAELPGINYSTAPESPAVVSDAAAIGSALGASRVVLLTTGRPMVVDVRRAELVRDETATVVEHTLGLFEPLPTTVNPPAPANPRVDVSPRPTRGPGAGPWVLVGAGVAALAAGGAFLYLRDAPLQEFHVHCFADGSCPSRAEADAGQPFHDDASLYTTLTFVAGSVGVAAIAGGVLWYALAPRRPVPVALRLSPWAAPSATGITLEGRF